MSGNALCDVRSVSPSRIRRRLKTTLRRNAEENTSSPFPRLEFRDAAAAAAAATTTTTFWRRSTPGGICVRQTNEDRKSSPKRGRKRKIATTAREAFLATLNFKKKNAMQGDVAGRNKKRVTIGSSKIEKSTAESDLIAIPFGLIDPSKCTATGTLVSGCKKKISEKSADARRY